MAWNALIIAIQGGRVAFGFLLTQEVRARECHSFLSLLKQDRRRVEERGAQGGADRATANTKNGCGSGPPLVPPLCSQNTSLLLKRNVIYFGDYFPKCGDVNSTFWRVWSSGRWWWGAALSGRGCPTPPVLLFLSVFWHQREQRKSKAPKGFPQCWLWMILMAPAC